MSIKLNTVAALRWCGSSLGLVLSWAVWLALGVLLVLQIWVATRRELTVPDFALRALERRLGASEVTARFGRAIFDPTGRVVLEDVQLLSSDYATPLLTIHAVFARLDFWALLVGSLRLQEIHLTGVELHLPAMLSPSGTDEALVSDLDGAFRLGRSEYDIDLCTFRLAGVPVTTHGGFILPNAVRPRPGSLPLLDLVLQRYLKAGRKLVTLRTQLEALEDPRLQLVLTPSESRGAMVDAQLYVRAYRQPAPVSLASARAHAVFPLLGEAPFATQVRLEADEVAWNGRAGIKQARLDVAGSLTPDRLAFALQSAQLTAASGDARGIPFTAPFADLALDRFPRVQGRVSAAIDDASQTVSGEIDVKRGDGALEFSGSLPPLLLRLAAAIPGFTAAQRVKLEDPVRGTASVELAPGWKPVRAEADVSVGHVEAQGVRLDAARAHVAYAEREFHVTDLVLRQGENEAQGSYTMDIPTRDYRFLLHGRLRPPDIAGWFKGWWPNFWKHFDFTTTPPVADVDVQGRWGAPQQSAVFVHVDADRPAIRGVAFDHVRTTLFVRPYYYDVFEFAAEHGGHSAHGRFLLTTEPQKAMYRTLDFDAEGDLEPAECAQLYGPAGLAYLAPYGFTETPQARVNGHLAGPGAPGGRRSKVSLALTTRGRVTFHGIPLDSAKFSADLENDRLDLRHVEVGIAGGALSGEAQLHGPAGARRLAFEGSLQGANLGHFIDAVGNLQILRKAATADRPKSRFLENAASCELDLTLKAEGRFHDYLSYRGEGSCRIHGHGLVEVPLLKLLFELLSKSLLNFKSQRLDTAQSNFRVEGRRLVFPDLKISGPSAAIEAGGEYLLDAKTLDFTAKISPFKEHHFVLTDVLGIALTPLLSTLEVRLTGQLANPSWSLTFLRSLTPPHRPGEVAPAGATVGKPSELQLVPDDAVGGMLPPTPAPADPVPAPPANQPPSPR